MANRTMLRRYEFDASLADQLRDEHREMEQWFGYVVEEARGGDWRACWDAWHPFVSLVERHMQFEERKLFPILSTQGPDRARLANELRDEHEKLRERLLEISIDIELKVTNVEHVAQIVEDLRHHAARENDAFYPWVERSGELLHELG